MIRINGEIIFEFNLYAKTHLIMKDMPAIERSIRLVIIRRIHTIRRV